MLVTVSDMLKILDAIPIWKSLTSLPKRVAELEARVAALEGAPAPPVIDPAEQCPKCHGALALLSEQKAAHFGNMGMKTRRFCCNTCQEEFTRNWHPAKGYC